MSKNEKSRKASEWYRNNRERAIATRRKRLDANGWYVYYIPSDHYCGLTNDLPRRRSWHKHMGTDVEGFRVLYHSMDKSSAAYHEAMFQGVLGIHGVNVKGVK